MRYAIGFLACALTLSAAPIAAAAERIGGAPIEFPFVRLALALILCSLIALLAALWLKRTMQAGAVANLGKSLFRASPREIRIFETHRISPHADICRLVCGDTEYFIVLSANGASVLKERATKTELPLTELSA